ncbi:hypothetical protein [Agrococcus carbonis]|uniref:MNN4 protein n=1 Tax=Agrococcus carbonis TaxID=684552 RepID=A0A1H1SE21_9MICO|nr:hypothetical protein [Agrococcus carbonis]SDS45609.1 hypothetical protein SAMN04489719_2362 [Agrococcus carbonis]
MSRARRIRRVMTDDRRRVLRWWLLLGLIPFALAAIVLATKLIGVNVLAQTAADRFDGRAYAQGAEAARGLETWNWVEPWKAPFAVGVNLTMAGSLEEGRAKIEESLTLHGEPTSPSRTHEHCVIVASLVTAIEKQGDVAREADDRQAANGFYREALALIDQQPDGCFDPPRPDEADTAEQLDAAVPRIEEKIEDDSGQGEGEGEGEGENDGEPQTPEEQLEEQNQEAQEQQQQQDQYDESEGEGSGGPPVDRPW